MAGEVKVAVVTNQLSAGATGTTDFTGPTGFGTPKGWIIITTWARLNDGTVDPQGRLSIGFGDGTNDYCIASQDEHSQAKVDCDGIKSDTKSYIILDAAADPLIEGTSDTITDGVRTTNSAGAGSTTPYTTVVMFGGADLTVDLERSAVTSTEDGTATINTTGTDGNDRLIFFIGADISGEDNANSGVNNSFGFCHITGTVASHTINQRAIGYSSDHNNASAHPHQMLSTEHSLDFVSETGGDLWALEVTALATASTITVTTRDGAAGAGMEVYSLALDLDDRSAKIGDVGSPSGTGPWTPSVSLGFTPQFVGMVNTISNLKDVIDSTNSGTFGISLNDGSTESFHSLLNENLALDTVCQNTMANNAVHLRGDDGASVIYDWDHTSFNDGDWTYEANTTGAVRHQLWFAIEEAAAAGEAITVPAETGGIVLSTAAPTFTQDLFITPPVEVGGLVLSTAAPTIVQNEIVSPLVEDGGLVLSTAAPTVDQSFAQEVPTVTLVLTPYAANTHTNILLTVAPDLVLSTTAPTVNIGFEVVPPVEVGGIILSTTAPTITQNFIRVPLVEDGGLVLSTAAPTVDQSFAQEVPTEVGGLVLSTAAPITVENFIRVPLVGGLTLTTAAPTVDQSFAEIVPSATLTLSTTAPAQVANFIRIPPVEVGGIVLSTAAATKVVDFRRGPPAHPGLVLAPPVPTKRVNFRRTPPVEVGGLVLSTGIPTVDATSSDSHNISVPAQPGGLAIAGVIPPVDFGFPNAPTVTLTLSTTAPVANQSHAEIPGSENLTLSTAAPTIVQNFNRVPLVEAGGLVLSTAAPTVDQSFAEIPGSVTLTLSTAAPTIVQNFIRVPLVGGPLALSTTAPLVDQSFAQEVPTVTLTLSTAAPAVDQSFAEIPGSATLTLSTTAPSIVQNFIRVPSVEDGGLVLSTTSPEVCFGFIPVSATLSLTTTAPDVEAILGEQASPGSATLTLSTAAPAVSKFITVPSATITLTSDGFGLEGQTVIVPVAPCTLSTTAPAVHRTFDEVTGGTRMFVVNENPTGQLTEGVYQFTLTTPYDITTAIFDGVVLDSSPESGPVPSSIDFKPDGTRAFLAENSGQTTNELFGYDLSTPWNIGTGVFDPTQVANLGPAISGVWWNKTGEEFIMIDMFRDWARHYTLTTPWDLTTESLEDGTNLDFFDPSDSEPRGLAIDPTGVTLITIGGKFDKLQEYQMGDPWVLGFSIVWQDVQFDFSPQTLEGRGIYIPPNGLRIFLTDRDGRIFSYTMTTPWDISTASYDEKTINLNSDPQFAFADWENFSPTGIYIVSTEDPVIPSATCTLSTAAPNVVQSVPTATLTLTTSIPDVQIDTPISFSDPFTNIQLFPFQADCFVAEDTLFQPFPTALQCFSFAPDSQVDDPIIPEPATATCTLTTAAPTTINESEDPDVTVPVAPCTLTTGVPIINAWIKQAPLINKTWTKQAPAVDETWTACTSPTIAATYTKVVP